MKHMSLKAERIRRGLNQEDLAKLIGVSKQTYWSKENGRSPFFLDEIKKIKDHLGVDFEEIFKGE